WENEVKTDGVVSARPQSGIGPQSSRASLVKELEAVRMLLDQGQASLAASSPKNLIKAPRHEPSLLARAHCTLSVALEMQGRHRESLEVVQIYESAASRDKLDVDTAGTVRGPP